MASGVDTGDRCTPIHLVPSPLVFPFASEEAVASAKLRREITQRYALPPVA